MSIIIAIDNGKSNMKALCGNKELIYANKYSLGHTDEQINGENTFNVTYDGKEYTIGDKANHSDKLEGKASLPHVISCLTAITRFIKANEKENIIIVYGESVDMYYNKNQKEKIKEELEGKHKISVDGIEYSFMIETVHILPEGIGHILQDLENNSGIQYVVDLGGTTMNFLSVIDGRPDEEKSFSEGLGKHNIVAKLKKALKKTPIGNIPNDLVEQYLEKGSSSEEIEKIRKEVIIEHFKIMDERLAEYEMDLHTLLEHYPVTFIGGTSKLLEKEIKIYYKAENGRKATIYDSPLMANARGFHAYGIAKYGDKQ